jgi:hypothetical protein
VHDGRTPARAASAVPAALAAQEAVVRAEQELAEAQARLAAAEAAAAGEEAPTPEPSEPTEPAEPPATVARVKPAEAEFAAAQAGITDETRLVQAAEQFNAAAVALEVSWLALFADTGCLTGAQAEQAADAVRA